MPARLIINADDFGLTPGINRSVEDLHRAGALTSATLMAGGPAFQDAIAVAHRSPSLGVGCHIVLTDGIPISRPESIPSLIGPDGKSFRPSLLAFATAALTGQLREQDIRSEALAQIRLLQRSGIQVTHLDTHKHAHLFPSVSRPLLEVACQASVRAIRNPFEQPWSLDLGHGTRLRSLQIHMLNSFEHHFTSNPILREGSVATTDGSAGIAATGFLDRTTLRDLLQQLPAGTWELVCHPGYIDEDLDNVATRLRAHRDIERTALLEIVPQILSQPGAPALIHYGDLAGGIHTSASHNSSNPARKHERLP